MKTLVLQLARLGDILQTWPTLRALNRCGDDVHVLVRPRFRSALNGLAAVTHVHEFDSTKVLVPVLGGEALGSESVGYAKDILNATLERLAGENFDRIINLSFSPLSSWITFDLEQRAEQAGRKIQVSGYTRHADGALAIPDDSSAYFFAQVGFRARHSGSELLNRIPVPRLFAAVAGVDLVESDWAGPDAELTSDEGGRFRSEAELPEDFVAFHIGASEEHKTIEANRWSEIATSIVRRCGVPVILLGAKHEEEKAQRILSDVEQKGISTDLKGSDSRRVLSYVGKTEVFDLFDILKHASVLVAGDSALVQAASLVGTKVLNLSARSVSHWETGPLSRGSRILLYGGAGPDVDTIAQEVLSMRSQNEGSSMSRADRFVAGPLEKISDRTYDAQNDFLWQLTAAMYLGHEAPINRDLIFQGVVTQWLEVLEIERHQLCALSDVIREKREGAQTITGVLERIDELMGLLVESEPKLAPVLRWLQTEKVRIPPQETSLIIERSLELNLQLNAFLLSLSTNQTQKDGARNDRLAMES